MSKYNATYPATLRPYIRGSNRPFKFDSHKAFDGFPMGPVKGSLFQPADCIACGLTTGEPKNH